MTNTAKSTWNWTVNHAQVGPVSTWNWTVNNAEVAPVSTWNWT